MSVVLARVPLALILAATAGAQGWSSLESAPRQLGGLVYDAAHQRLVGFSQLPQQTWSFDGTEWRQHRPDGFGVFFGAQPVTLFAGYDDARGQAVAVASATSAYQQGLTYVSVHAGWQRVQQASGLDVQNCGIAFDPNSNRLLTFGGLDATFQPTDAMHAWNGSAWTTLAPAMRPSPRSSPAMALDRARSRIVLYGGSSTGAGGDLSDTWEWNGSSWTQLFPTVNPGPRSSAMAYDGARQRVVLLGGTGATLLQDSWEWNGAQWTPTGNLPISGSLLASRDGSTVVIGTRSGELWRRSGTAWNPLWSDPRPQAYEQAMAWDPTRGELLLWPDYPQGNTWTWNGSWTQHTSTAPPQRLGAALAPLGSDMVLFGGADPTWYPLLALFDETWRWNGQSWTQALPAASPSPRRGHAMTGIGSGVLLFGGRDQIGEVNDTWRYDGVTWTQLQPASSPPARQFHMLEFDAPRQRAVLFGGYGQNVPLDDTWEWDGQNWTTFTTTGQPSAGAWPMAATGSEVVLAQLGEMWTWSGTDWSSSQLPANQGIFYGRMVFDTVRQRLVLRDDGRALHVFGPTPATVASTWQSCGNSTDLRLLGRPGIGSTPNVHCEGAPNALVFTVFGLQLQQVNWGNGCTQYVSNEAVLLATTDNLGMLDLPLAIPAALGLRGVELHAQAVVLDGGPVFGGSITAALHLTIGD